MKNRAMLAKVLRDDIRSHQAQRDFNLFRWTPPRLTSPEEEARLAEQAKNFPVTKLPYKGPRRHGRVQFRIKRRTPGIAFSDFDRMHIDRRSDNAEQWIPEFANNDKELQRVLAQSAWEHMLKHGPVPDEFVENIGELQALSAAYVERLAKQSYGQAPRRRLERVADTMVESIVPCDEHFSNIKTHIITVKKAGGYIERNAAVAYHTWRLRRDSPTVGAELGLTATLVRHILGGLCASARRLGFDALPPRGDHTRGKLRMYRPNLRSSKLPMAEELLGLVLSGKTFREIADQFGVTHESSVRSAYQRAKKVVIQQMREQGATWEEVAKRFGTETAKLAQEQVAA